MPTVYGELEIACPTAQVYAYLRDRYKTDIFRSVSMMTRGYVPEIQCIDEQKDERLSFSASARDCLLHFKAGSWTWTYQLTRLEKDKTKVAVTYEWSILLSLLSMFTVRGQAANELSETALALVALGSEQGAATDGVNAAAEL